MSVGGKVLVVVVGNLDMQSLLMNIPSLQTDLWISELVIIVYMHSCYYSIAIIEYTTCHAAFSARSTPNEWM